jgi:predicted PurR-regulated permease PerM
MTVSRPPSTPISGRRDVWATGSSRPSRDIGSAVDAVADLTAGDQPARVPAGEHADDPALDTPTVAVLPGRRLGFRLVPTLAVIVALWWGQIVIIPLVLSVLVSYALEPFVSRMGSARIARPVAVPLLLIVLVGGTGFGIYSLRTEAVLFIEQLPEAARTVRQVLQPDPREKPGTVAKVQQAAQELERAARAAAGQNAAQVGVTPVRIEEPTFRWSDYLWQGSRGALEFGGQLFVILCLVYYLLVSGDLYKRKLVRIAGPSLSRKKITVQILEEIDRQIERFLLARVFISVIVGVVIWVSFRMLGLREAGIWGLIAAVLFAIPYVGPAVVTIGAAIAGFVQFGSLAMAATAGGTSLAIAAIEGNVLTPWLMGRVGRMNTVAVFMSLLFWGWIWGVWGLLLAVPIMVAAKAVCERIEDLSRYAELLKE